MTVLQIVIITVGIGSCIGGLNLWHYLRLKQKYKKLTDQHRQFIHLVETPNDFMYYADVYPVVKFKYLSPSAENFFGKGSNDLAYLSPEVAFQDIHPDDQILLMKKITGDIDYSQPVIQRWKDQNGKYRWFEEYATPIYENGKLVSLQGMLRNIDERIVLQEKLQYQLYHDSLTDLYNRTYFKEAFTKLDEEESRSAGMLLCDLDQLKFTNDTFGHSVGDELIKKAAAQLKIAIGDAAIAARIGGDEFVILMQDINEQELYEQMDRIRKSCREAEVFLSIGAAFTPDSGGRMTALFSEADRNMYKNKEINRQCI